MSLDDVKRKADAVCDAVRRHAAAVVEGGVDRIEAGPALVAALDDYGLAVANAGFEPPKGVTDVEWWLDEEDGIEQPEDEPDASDYVALFVRADFAVEDIETLRASAIEEMQSCCPVPPGKDPAEQVRRAADAAAQLFGHLRSVFNAEDVEQHGLRLVAEYVEAASVKPEVDTVDEDLWTPLLNLRDETGDLPSEP